MGETFFMKRRAAAHSAHIELRTKWHKRQKGGVVNSYCTPVKYFLEMYATNDVITKTDVDMRRYTLSKSPTGTPKPFGIMY